jgi:hypothetical protein
MAARCCGARRTWHCDCSGIHRDSLPRCLYRLSPVAGDLRVWNGLLCGRGEDGLYRTDHLDLCVPISVVRRGSPDEAGGYLPISLTGRVQRVGFKLPVPFLVGDVAWGGRCTNPFTNPGTYTWTSKCPEATTLRDYASILWLAHSGPPAHESASASVTCDTGHAYDLISFPIVDNHLHWSGTVTVTHLSS